MNECKQEDLVHKSLKQSISGCAFFFLFFVHSYPRFQNAAGHRGCLPHTGAVGSDQSWVLLNSFGMELAATGPVDLEVTLLCWNVATTRFINSTNSLMFPFSVMKLSALTVEYFYYFITADRKEWLRSEFAQHLWVKPSLKHHPAQPVVISVNSSRKQLQEK